MTRQGKDKLQAAITEDSPRRQEEANAPLWTISLQGDSGKLDGEYDPGPALKSLAKIWKSNGMSPDEVEKYVQRARQIMHAKIHTALRDALDSFVDDEVPYQLFIGSGETRPPRAVEREYLKTVKRRTLARATNQMRARIGIENHGRPASYTKAKLEQMLRGAVSRFRKRNYRNPSLPEAVNEIKKSQPMSLAAMKKLLQRYDLRYSTYKKET